MRLPIMCPSNLGAWADGLYAEPCSGRECWWWRKGDGCTAAISVEAELPKFRRLLRVHRPPPIPPCALAERCRWHIDAQRRDLVTCAPRRLGIVCQHQGGEWNTFEFQEAL